MGPERAHHAAGGLMGAAGPAAWAAQFQGLLQSDAQWSPLSYTATS